MTLNEIPDSELQELNDYGFTILWLVGIWTRCPASQTIKHKYGEKSKISSAYSIWDYTVASDIGGKSSFLDLQSRANKLGITLMVDFVPNHWGILSQWIVEYPERFLQIPDISAYDFKFAGPNVSHLPEYELYLEDDYWIQKDAAPVFKLINRETDQIRYFYHGCDGGIPWNDTVQLDFSQASVRSAVIEQMIDIIQLNPVIRIDAAMVLVKQHIQRLWHPIDGESGYVRTRDHFTMDQKEFDTIIPDEFWNEAIAAIKSRVPYSMLIAEVYWKLENTFVQELNMDFVYNSAFMHLLREEKNEKLSEIIQENVNTDTTLMGKYVNYLSNPDEDPAISSFGVDRKYMGSVMLLATFPGAPLFNHGQIDGFKEKYAMDLLHPQLRETANEELRKWFKSSVTPLLETNLFTSSVNFRWYIVRNSQGQKNSDVFVYSNKDDTEVFLCMFNNSPRTHIIKFDQFATLLEILVSPATLSFTNYMTKELIKLDMNTGELELTLDSYEFVLFTGFKMHH